MCKCKTLPVPCTVYIHKPSYESKHTLSYVIFCYVVNRFFSGYKTTLSNFAVDYPCCFKKKVDLLFTFDS